MKKTLIRCTHHYDILWRRPFDRDFYYNGKRYVSYADIEQMGIDSWLEMAEQSDLKFDLECVWTLRKYLERNPEKKERIQKLFDEGKFELLAGGLLIPDTNMPLGETLVRNYAYGLLWAQNTLGNIPQIGCLNDSFGVSAQIPQIYRGCGVKWVTGLSYSYPTKDYWRGLDGSIIYIQQHFVKSAKKIGPANYYSPCDACNGKGCHVCKNTGVNPFVMTGELESMSFDRTDYPYNIVKFGDEESISTPELPQMVMDANARYSDEKYQFFTPKDLIAYHKADIDAVDCPDPDRISPEVEGGPNSSGTLVSRIKVKQRLRALENELIPLEKLCSLLYLNGAEYPREELRQLWEDAIFAAFHDSVTGTHIDPGYDELMDTFDRAELAFENLIKKIHEDYFTDDCAITIYNPTDSSLTDIVTAEIPCGDPIVLYDQHGSKITVSCVQNHGDKQEVEFLAENIPAGDFFVYTWKVCEETPCMKTTVTRHIENEYFVVQADSHGITGIYDKINHTELIDTNKGYANELILENDFGDPWATRELDRKRTRLGMDTVLSSVNETAHYSEMIFEGSFHGNESVWYPRDYRVMILKWKQIVRLYKGIRRVEFKTDIDWDTFDRRIRISFPTKVHASEDRGNYSVPYGVVSRDRYEFSRTGWNNANGDYPAVEWFSTAGDCVNVAIMNRGTPCARIENGEMLLSVLRSPTFPNCLLWPEFYNAPVYDGMRDYGSHSFEYAFTSFLGEWSESDIVQEAEVYNRASLCFSGRCKLPLSGIRLDAKSVRISSIKQAEDAKGLIVRLAEVKGNTDYVKLMLPKNAKFAFVADLLERETQKLPISAEGEVYTDLHPFEIQTIKILF